jgi:20S proteasome alpha/beta subunit
MTLIIGIKCSDGIVIGSDRKVTRGGEVEYSNKIFEVSSVLFAIEGMTGIRDDFLLLLNNEIRQRKGIDTLYEMKVIVEDIIEVLSKRYKDRIKEESPVGVLMGGLEELDKGKAKMYYIHGVGYGEETNFLCTGHGGPYATSIAKFYAIQNYL